MKAGDKIRIQDVYGNLEDFTVEEFHYSLGIYQSNSHREAGNFTPLSKLFGAGPDSAQGYVSNYGEYTTNMVPAYMNLPRD